MVVVVVVGEGLLDVDAAALATASEGDPWA
jgi:hypothetical protein